ncbi:MAG: L-seryl-tRNA(Sec) selenium transferase [Gemmatimonadetes bacterium]|nr:L-seryl-tRNA(Sec) selenium transferase [Gemmatimonadota bacterium]
MAAHLLAALPSVHEVLRHPEFQAASPHLADPYRARLVQSVIQRHRDELRSGTSSSTPESIHLDVLRSCIGEARAIASPFPRRVINGTGVLVHTNFGRAPLGELLSRIDARALAGYTDLEWDPGSGQRGNRDVALGRALCLLTGAEAALVVNNCASALLLGLNTLAAGKEVLVSRSELVEIGGSFRVPEIMQASGCVLREVGTTNRTRLDDFARAARAGESVLLKVHQSNFVQRGFVQQVPVQEMVGLGGALGIPVIEDNGSGLMSADGVAVLDPEPRVAASLDAGVDVVCCSADKLFGSIQTGIILGRAEMIAKMRQSPLYRVLRLDKLRLAVLDAALKLHLAGAGDDLPLWRLFHTDQAELDARIGGLRLPGPQTRWASCRRVPLRATLGGGSNPEATFASAGLELVHRDLSADALKRRLSTRDVPIVGYVRQDRLYLDVRTFFPDDFPQLQRALDELSGEGAAE